MKLGTQQAAYEKLNAAQLKTTPHARRDRIWAATVQCGLSSVPRKQSAAPADAAVVARATQRNVLLREQGIAIPWDHVTQWKVAHFWTAERGLAADSEAVSRHLRIAANGRTGGEESKSHSQVLLLSLGSFQICKLLKELGTQPFLHPCYTKPNPVPKL